MLLVTKCIPPQHNNLSLSIVNKEKQYFVNMQTDYSISNYSP